MMRTAQSYETTLSNIETVRNRREQYMLMFTRYFSYLLIPSGLMLFLYWVFSGKSDPTLSYQMLVCSLLAVFMGGMAAVYRVFRKFGHPTIGGTLTIATIIITYGYMLTSVPEARFGALGGFVIAIVVGSTVFGRKGGILTAAACAVQITAAVIYLYSPNAPQMLIDNQILSIFINLMITGLVFVFLTVMINGNVASQERYIDESEKSSREIQQRIIAEHEQLKKIEEANQRIEMQAEAERAQRQKVMELIDQVREAARELNTAATEILAASTQQATGASQQSAAIAQTSVTTDEVRAITEQTMALVQAVDDSSQRALEVSKTGQTAVQETISSMDQIKEKVEGIAENVLALSEQTQQIGEIINTVGDLASQSNMLALNASVEAARAGEHGKGFSVVAAEVRSLAEQSRQATLQVKAIIDAIQRATNATVMATEEGNKGVDAGLQRVIQARQAIESLGNAVNDNAEIARQVVSGGRQQQAGMEQIAVAIQNINQATNQNLVSTRQTEKAAQNLNELARKLNTVVENT